MGDTPAEATGPARPESITNTQEAGVDEGGIVKRHGDHLVVLRRGRLFTIHVGGGELGPVAKVDAFPPGTRPDTWYDELLVSGDTVAVLGFSYEKLATELGLFDIDDDGRLRHRSTYYLRSNDYYSSRNYASRLIGSDLILYMPYALIDERWRADGPHVVRSFPSIRRHARQGGARWRRIIPTPKMYRPVQHTDHPILHTVVTCDLSRRELTCRGRGVIGPHARTFYVSRTAIYVWVGGGWDAFATTGERAGLGADAVLYRLPLDGSDPSAVRVRGAPVDQFSFKESGDHLHVLTRTKGGGDAMWHPELTGGDVVLLRLPLAIFAEDVPVVAADRYVRLPRPTRGQSFQNRFVGDSLLYGTGTTWGAHRLQYDERVFIHRTSDGLTGALPLSHGVDRVEALGGHAMVVGTDGQNLHFNSVRLSRDDAPEITGRFTQADAAQGETRSHGFFYRPESEQDGLLGLPVTHGGRPGVMQLRHGSAAVLFLRVRNLELREIGALTGNPTGADDQCIASCADWYGNARPIFLGDRIFALLGYELVEGTFEAQDRLRERTRLHFLDPARASAAH